MRKSPLLLLCIVALLLTPQVLGDLQNIAGCTTLFTSGRIYNLTGDAATDPDTCMNVITDNVTLECNGYRLPYAGSNPGFGFKVNGSYENVTVQNCVFEAFSGGVGRDTVSVDAGAEVTVIKITSTLVDASSKAIDVNGGSTVSYTNVGYQGLRLTVSDESDAVVQGGVVATTYNNTVTNTDLQTPFVNGVLDHLNFSYVDMTLNVNESHREGKLLSGVLDAGANRVWQYVRIEGAGGYFHHDSKETGNLNMSTNTLYLHFDESSGNSVDYSILANGTTSTDIEYNGRWFEFNGSSSVLIDSYTTEVLSGCPTSNWCGTYSVWARYDDDSVTHADSALWLDPIIMKNAGDPSLTVGTVTAVGSTGVYAYAYQSPTSYHCYIGAGKDEWHHYAMVANGTHLVGYMDGVETCAVSLGSSGWILGDDYHRMGYLPGSGEYFEGGIDEVLVFSDILSPAEIWTLYNQGRNIRINGSACDDAACSGETNTTFTYAGDGTYTIPQSGDYYGRYVQYSMELLANGSSGFGVNNVSWHGRKVGTELGVTVTSPANETLYFNGDTVTLTAQVECVGDTHATCGTVRATPRINYSNSRLPKNMHAIDINDSFNYDAENDLCTPTAPAQEPELFYFGDDSSNAEQNLSFFVGVENNSWFDKVTIELNHTTVGADYGFGVDIYLCGYTTLEEENTDLSDCQYFGVINPDFGSAPYNATITGNPVFLNNTERHVIFFITNETDGDSTQDGIYYKIVSGYNCPESPSVRGSEFNIGGGVVDVELNKTSDFTFINEVGVTNTSNETSLDVGNTTFTWTGTYASRTDAWLDVIAESALSSLISDVDSIDRYIHDFVYGYLWVNISDPPNSTEYNNGDSFEMNATVQCLGSPYAVCGEVKATPRINYSNSRLPKNMHAIDINDSFNYNVWKEECSDGSPTWNPTIIYLGDSASDVPQNMSVLILSIGNDTWFDNISLTFSDTAGADYGFGSDIYVCEYDSGFGEEEENYDLANDCHYFGNLNPDFASIPYNATIIGNPVFLKGGNKTLLVFVTNETDSDSTLDAAYVEFDGTGDCVHVNQLRANEGNWGNSMVFIELNKTSDFTFINEEGVTNTSNETSTDLVLNDEWNISWTAIYSDRSDAWLDVLFESINYTAIADNTTTDMYISTASGADISFTVSYPATGCQPGLGCSTGGCTACTWCAINGTGDTFTDLNCTGQTDAVSFWVYTNDGDVAIDIQNKLNESIAAEYSFEQDTDNAPAGSTTLTTAFQDICTSISTPSGTCDVWGWGTATSAPGGNYSINITGQSQES